MNLGYIDYLNCYPFYFHMFERKPVSDVRLIPGYPSDLNRMMGSRELDMSPVSAAACSQLSDKNVLLPDFCLSSVGYVMSVVLKSKVPIEDLQGKKVGITSASFTSLVLLKILLKHYYKVEPVYSSTSPSPSLEGLDAALIIGNEALVGNKSPVPYSYDLGELWLRKTGFPVVFAVFMVRTEAIQKHLSEIRSVIESYRNSLGCLNTERASVIAGAQKRYPDIIYDIDSYYRVLQFNFNDQLKKALTFYLDAGAELGFLNKKIRVNFLNAADISR